MSSFLDFSYFFVFVCTKQGNKSGCTGNRDNENNYTDVEWLAKKIHEEIEENKAQKEGIKLAKDKLEKDKCALRSLE